MNGRENVFRDMPDHGDVVATLDAEDKEKIDILSMQLSAIQYAKKCDETEDRYIGIYENYKGAWIAFSRKYGFPYAWPVTYDPSTGKVYIDNK